MFVFGRLKVAAQVIDGFEQIGLEAEIRGACFGRRNPFE